MALQHAKSVGAKIMGVVGRDGGYTAQVADACVILPTVNPENVTRHSEAFQAVSLAFAGIAPEAEGVPDEVGIRGRDREARPDEIEGDLS